MFTIKGLPTLRRSDVQRAKVNFGLTWQRTCPARGAYRSLGNRKAWVPPSCSRKSYPLGEEKNVVAPQTLPLVHTHTRDETEPGAETDSTNTDIRHPFHLWSDLGIPVPHNPSPPSVSLVVYSVTHTHLQKERVHSRVGLQFSSTAWQRTQSARMEFWLKLALCCTAGLVGGVDFDNR